MWGLGGQEQPTPSISKDGLDNLDCGPCDSGPWTSRMCPEIPISG